MIKLLKETRIENKAKENSNLQFRVVMSLNQFL